MEIYKKLLFFLFIFTFTAFPVFASDNSQNDFDESITIDGRTYKVSPDFVIPAGIDKDSPVKLNFSDETHELLSIERLIEDDSDSNDMEYHFGIVNAITRANTDLEYRVYVDGVGYLFTRNTRIDERIAFLDKYASVALVTKNGETVICRVLSSNTAIPGKDIFFGKVEHARKEDNFYTLTIDGENYVIDAETNTIGTVMIPETWVFGYRINEKVRFISAITEEFPNPAEAESFQGFVNFVGDIGENGSFYITVGDTTLRVLPDTAIKGSVSQGDYVSGFRIKKDILLLKKPVLTFDKSRCEVYYQVIDDVVSVRDINSPTGQSVVSIILGEREIEINSFTNVVGELKKGVPAIAVLCDGIVKIVVVCDTVDGGKVPVSGFISSIAGTAPNYSLVIEGKTYSTSFATVIAAEKAMEPGIQVAGIADREGLFDLLTCYGSVLPEGSRNHYTGVISKIAVNAFQIDDRVIDYDSETIISGSFTEGKYALVSLEGEYADVIYILPDDYSDFDYHTASGVLNGISTEYSNGKKAIRLDETVYYIDSDTTISRNLAYDEIGTVLYKGLNQVSIIDVLPKPVDKGAKFSGKITGVNSSLSGDDLSVTVGGAVYAVSPVAACIGFSDFSRLSTGANVEGYVYGNDILAVRLIRGAGLFGILNPPWIEYVLAGCTLAIFLVFILLSAIRNRITKHTGSPEEGHGNTIILHEENGQINSYTVDESLFDYISCLNEKKITVRVRCGKIIEVSMICLLLFVICVNSAFADYIGPNPDLRIYTEYTIEQISITGVYVQCVDDTASPARTLGQFCDISGSNAPEGMTPPSVTSCSSFAGANKSVRTQTSCEYNTTIGVNVQKQADNATASVSTVCSGTTGADGWCSGNITLTLSGNEPKPNNSLNGGEIVIAGDSQTKRGSQPYTFDVSKEGSNDVSYWVYSTVGDTSEKGQTHVKIDKTAPKAVCDVKSSPTFGEWFTGNVKIEAKSTDAISGVYENQFSSGSTTSKNSITLSQTGKNIGVSLTAKDYAYNTNQVSCGSFSIDNTAPVLDSFTVPDSSPYGNRDLTFSVSGHDNESGVKTVTIIIDGEEHSTGSSQKTVSVSFDQTGTHTVSYRITDNVGLTAESSVFSFLIDINPPDLIINEISHNGVSGLLVPGDTVSGFGTDPGSGFSKVYISFPENNSFKSIDYNVISPAPPAESIVWSSTADFSVPSGKYNVSVKGTDKVGNESVVVSVPVTVDADAPVTDYTVSGNQSESGWYRGSVTVTAASTDQGTGVMSETVSLSCSPAVSIVEGKSVTIPASYSGTCSITVKASDYADNKSENTVNNAVKIDNTAPTSSSFSPAAGSVHGNQVHACISGAKDQHSGLKSGYLRSTGADGEKKLTSAAQGGNQVCFDTSFTTDGSYSLFFELEDKAGNKNGESAAVVITVDATGPEIHFTSVPASFKNRDATVTYTGSGSDSITGIGSASYSIDGGETWENLELAEDGSFTITASPYERMTVRVSMTDKAGNETLIESAPLVKVSDVSAKLSVPAATEANMLIRPVVVDMEGNAIDDYSGIESARAFVYGRGYDHRDIELFAKNNYAFRWDGTFPKDEARETEDGETVIIEGSVEAPEGWYWLTIEVTDVDGNINCYNTRIHAGKSTPKAEPVKAPEYTSFDISGKVNGMDSVSVTVSGTRYMLADFSRIEAGISNNTRVIGKGRAYTKENVLVVESLQAVKETLTPFSGLVDDLGTDYVIIDGHALAISDETQRYCEDIRTGDYVSGLYRTENGTMIATEFGPLSCERNEITRTDTGIVDNK